MKHVILSIFLFVFAIQFLNAQNKYEFNGNELILPCPIIFETGTDKIDPASEPALLYVVNYLTDKTYISTLRIECHVAPGKNEQKQLELTQKRAMAISKWIVNHGIDCSRLIAVGFGSDKPIADNAIAEGRAANNRCVFVNAALRNRAIGGMPLDGGGMVAGDPCK